jgi:hypothetical protein
MTVPAIIINKLEGGLGITAGATGRMLALMGPSSAGTANAPVALARASDVVSQFGDGSLVESACYAIQHYGRPVLLVKTAASTAGDPGTLGTTGWTGSIAVTVTGTPYGSYEYQLKIITGGTVGTAGIILQWSLDGGRNWSVNTALGTANSFVIPRSGITLNFAAGNAVAADIVTGVSVGPAATSSDLTTPLTALYQTTQDFEFVHLTSPVDPTIGATLDAWVAQCVAAYKPKWWLGNAALPTAAQSDSVYQTAIAAAFASYSTTCGAVGAGAARIVSAVPGRAFNYVSPIARAVAPLLRKVPEHIRISEIDGMVLPGVSLSDANGNPSARCHDEYLMPGLDDARFLTLRTWPDDFGVWCNRPRLLSGTTSDYQMVPEIRVWNLGVSAMARFFKRRLQKPILGNTTTGFILESFAKELETSANKELAKVLAGKCAGTSIAVSRTDPLNVRPTNITVELRVKPFDYADYITENFGFAATL